MCLSACLIVSTIAPINTPETGSGSNTSSQAGSDVRGTGADGRLGLRNAKREKGVAVNRFTPFSHITGRTADVRERPKLISQSFYRVDPWRVAPIPLVIQPIPEQEAVTRLNAGKIGSHAGCNLTQM